MRNRSWLAQRIFEIPIILLGTSIVLFIVFYLVGGDSAQLLAGKYATQDSVDQIRQQLGTNQSLIAQYFQFLKEICTLNFGNSWATGNSVRETISYSMKPTLLLTLPAFLLSFIVSTLAGLLMSLNQGKKIDRLLLIPCFSLLSMSFLVMVILFQYFFAYRLGWFPISGWSEQANQWITYLSLPIIIYAIATFGKNALLFRTLFIEELEKPHIVFSKSKGLSKGLLMLRHVFKNSWPTLASILSSQVPNLFLGSLILENFFGIPGIGNLVIDAFNGGDFPMLKGLTIVGCLIYVLASLAADSQLIENDMVNSQ